MINIKGLVIHSGGKAVLDNIYLEIPGGETTVLLGKNGSGKSVLLKTLAGLIRNYIGLIEIEGKDLKGIYDNNAHKRSADCDFTFAYVFQKGGLFDSMNVYDNVAFPLRRQGIDEISIKKIVSNALQRVGLSGNEDKLPSELSGGMQKRVGFARAICLNPGIIFYDDPTAGLDPILSDSIADIIIDIKKAYLSTSLVVTHDLKIARKIADKIALL